MRARDADEPPQPIGFGGRDPFPERRQAVVPPPFVVQVGGGAARRLGNPSVLEHPVQRPVERAGLELQFAVSEGRNLLEDVVAMALLRREGEQDVEFDRSERHWLYARQLYAPHINLRRSSEKVLEN